MGKADFHLLEQFPAPAPTLLVAKSTDCQEDKNPRLHLEPPSLSPSLQCPVTNNPAPGSKQSPRASRKATDVIRCYQLPEEKLVCVSESQLRAPARPSSSPPSREHQLPTAASLAVLWDFSCLYFKVCGGWRETKAASSSCSLCRAEGVGQLQGQNKPRGSQKFRIS